MYDQIKTQLDSIAELSDEQVAELQDDIVSQFEMVEGEDPTPETVDAMTSLADSLDMVRAELSRREALAAELTAKAAEATARVKGEGEADEENMADMTEDEPETEEEESPMEETPDTEAAMDEEMKEEEVEVEETEADEAGMDSPEDEESDEDEKSEEMGYDKSEDEDEDEMSEASSKAEEASTVQEDGSELSTESEEVVEESTTAAEASTEEVAEAAIETEVEAEAAAEDEVAATETEGEAEASTESEPEAELSAEPEAELSVEAEEGSEASTDSETSIELSNTTEEVEEGQATVTASAEENFEAPADRRPVVQVTEAPVAITAGADIPGYTAGTEMKDMSEVATAMEKRLHSLRRVNGGDGEQHIVASFATQYPEERFLGTDPLENQSKIEAVVGQDALTASGGHAAPVEVQYDIYNIGSSTVRPVRDMLPRFQADRGGIRFVTPPQFADGTYADAVGVWTAATDADPQSNTKSSYTVTAAAENTVQTDAVTLQMQFGNLMTRAYPELIARHNELGLVQHAREAEANLLSKIGAGSTAVTTSSLIGFGRDFLVQLRRAATGYRSRHRLDPSTRLKAIIPAWVYDAMAADLALSMPGDGTLSVSQSEINGYLAASNVDLVASLDGDVFGAQASGAVNEFPDTFDWYLFAEGTFLFLDGGTLDLGIIRDSSLVGTNDYKMFVETFENVAKVGIESLKVTSTISVNGVAAALRDTTGGATAAAIEL